MKQLFVRKQKRTKPVVKPILETHENETKNKWWSDHKPLLMHQVNYYSTETYLVIHSNIIISKWYVKKTILVLLNHNGNCTALSKMIIPLCPLCPTLTVAANITYSQKLLLENIRQQTLDTYTYTYNFYFSFSNKHDYEIQLKKVESYIY